jgi:hypothetical protein
MGKIWAIAYVKKSETRDSIIDAILDENLSEDDDILEFDFVINNQKRLTKDFLKSKVYKRISSASTLCSILNRDYNTNTNKDIRLDKNHRYYQLPNDWIVGGYYGWQVKPQIDYYFKVVDITEKWNLSIDDEIKELEKKLELNKQRLINKKV